MVDKKQDGHTIIRFENGNVAEGPYVDGVLHGHWVIRNVDSTVEDLQYVNGEFISREPR